MLNALGGFGNWVAAGRNGLGFLAGQNQVGALDFMLQGAFFLKFSSSISIPMYVSKIMKMILDFFYFVTSYDLLIESKVSH